MNPLLNAVSIAALLVGPVFAKTEKYRICWNDDPTTEATIAWNQKSGKPGKVYFGTEDHERSSKRYPSSQSPDRIQDYDGMENCFVRLENLEPDTEYYFIIKDEDSTSSRFKFRTAPDRPKPFTFVAGGDSRNFRDVRIAANMLCEKLRPLFVAFTGDMINKDDAEEWDEWLDDWQHTTGKDGNMIPIVAHRGNHERRPETIPNYFDTPKDAYFSFSIGGDLFHYFALNSEIPARGDQEKWLDTELKKVSGETTHLVAGYHKPMRPHVSKKSEGDNPMAWANNFYRYGLDLALESDSHVMKRTLPLKPDDDGFEGFFAAKKGDKNATVYIGEGCWGAPLRAADDAKPWTLDTDSFNGIDWIRVSPEDIQIKTAKVKNVAKVERIDPKAPFKNPKGLQLWDAKGGEVLVVPADR